MSDDIQINTRKDLVADQIRDRILRGSYKPGARLDQALIAEALNVSRSPVREALRMLDAEGLITSIPNKGAVVTERSLEELKELYFTRSLIEGIAAERAAPHITQRTLEKLDSILYSAGRLSDHGELLTLNNEFHLLIYRSYPQPFIIQIVQQLRNMAAPYNSLYLDTDGNIQLAWADHRKIFDACVKGDAQKAKTETRRHLDRVCESLIRAAGTKKRRKK
jgi:DNA-binding GntR family transcriptional regulator